MIRTAPPSFPSSPVNANNEHLWNTRYSLETGQAIPAPLSTLTEQETLDSFSPPIPIPRRADPTEASEFLENTFQANTHRLHSLPPIKLGDISKEFSPLERASEQAFEQANSVMSNVAVANQKPLKTGEIYYIFSSKQRICNLNEALRFLIIGGSVQVNVAQVGKENSLAILAGGSQILLSVTQLNVWWASALKTTANDYK